MKINLVAETKYHTRRLLAGFLYLIGRTMPIQDFEILYANPPLHIKVWTDRYGASIWANGHRFSFDPFTGWLSGHGVGCGGISGTTAGILPSDRPPYPASVARRKGKHYI